MMLYPLERSYLSVLKLPSLEKSNQNMNTDTLVIRGATATHAITYCLAYKGHNANLVNDTYSNMMEPKEELLLPLPSSDTLETTLFCSSTKVKIINSLLQASNNLQITSVFYN